MKINKTKFLSFIASFLAILIIYGCQQEEIIIDNDDQPLSEIEAFEDVINSVESRYGIEEFEYNNPNGYVGNKKHIFTTYSGYFKGETHSYAMERFSNQSFWMSVKNLKAIVLAPNVSLLLSYENGFFYYKKFDPISSPRYINLEAVKFDGSNISTDRANYLRISLDGSWAADTFMGFAYEHSNFGGACLPIFDNYDLGLHSISWHNKISSIQRRSSNNADIPTLIDNNTGISREAIGNLVTGNAGRPFDENYTYNDFFKYINDSVDRIITKCDVGTGSIFDL